MLYRKYTVCRKQSLVWFPEKNYVTITKFDYIEPFAITRIREKIAMDRGSVQLQQKRPSSHALETSGGASGRVCED